MAPTRKVDGGPAWRRLGLVLKNEDQSAVDVPDSSTCHSDAQHIAPQDRQRDTQQDPQPSPKPAVNGKSSRLGKFKHQVKVAEETWKGSRASSKTDDSQKATVLTQSNAADVVIIQDLVLDKHVAQPKGDLNYRKKKGKPKPRRQEGRSGPPTEFSLARFDPFPAEDVALNDRPTLLASTETDFLDSLPPTQPKAQSKDKNTSSTPDRRKRVSFTPDTKTTDGNSGQTLFQKKIAGLKGTEPDSEAAPTARSAPTSNGGSSLTSTNSSTSSEKKKDSSLYLAYLMQYFTARHHWKFNKAKQNYLVDNALNIFRIPEDHSEALLEYISGLKGAGVIARLREKCEASLNEMNDVEAREQVQEEALQERISRERKRRKVEGDIEILQGHPHGDSYIRRLQRERGEALLTALSRAAPILSHDPHANGINRLVDKLAPHTRDSKKRKRREVSSDESSSDSSSEEDSSSSESTSESESESENSDSDSDCDSNTDTKNDTSSESDSDDEGSGDSNEEDGKPSEISKSSGGSSDSDTD